MLLGWDMHRWIIMLLVAITIIVLGVSAWTYYNQIS